VAVVSVGPYASLHVAPEITTPAPTPLKFFTGRMPFLPPNQQRQSTEGKYIQIDNKQKLMSTLNVIQSIKIQDD